MAQGYVALVLHAHLPYVRHPEVPDSLEERWLFEAVHECYLPLLDLLERLEAEQIPFRLTLSLSPTLMAMLDDPLLRRRCQAHLEACVSLADREVARAAGTSEQVVAHFHRRLFRRLLRQYVDQYGRDLLSGFHRLAQAGYIDLITCGATHGFLPLLQPVSQTVQAQIRVGVQEFRRRFGHAPRGFWLPECGYFPGVDQYLRANGVPYVIVETHALTHAPTGAPRGPFCHGLTPTGLAVFGRDIESSRQVWSAHEGYPGDSAYREFYRDIAWDREAAHLGRLAGPNGIRTFSGFKYHRVTGPTDQKELYDRWAAERTAARHAAHFLHQRRRQAAVLQGMLPGGPPPLIVAPYDAELFGHWWFEGPVFLEQLARQASQQDEIQFITPGDYLNRFPDGQGQVEPLLSSWGYRGYADFWCDGANHWIHRHLHGAGRSMVALAKRHRQPAPLERRLLNQAARELLLAQASDWPFILRTGTTVEYARRRLQAHLGRFHRLQQVLRGHEPADLHWLAQVETADSLFPDLDYGVFSDL